MSVFEDPITTIESAGYTNLIDSFIGDDAYSFVFDGESGYLDHTLSSGSLTPQWHIQPATTAGTPSISA